MSGAATAPAALVFPGQGSQRAGMGRDFYDASPTVRAVFAEASTAVGLDLAALCFGSGPELHLTEFTQPCILTTEIGMVRLLESEYGLCGTVFAGHSLGEYTALVAAGVLELAQAVRLVRRRGALMQDAVPPGEGGMVAVMAPGLDLAVVQREIAGLCVDAANYNSPSQIVVSGRRADLAEARRRFEALDYRCVPLQVSAPFHSRLMRGIEAPFAAELEPVRVHAERALRVASNNTGGFHAADARSIRERLVGQLSGTVRWVDNMRAVSAQAASTIEIGPGRPLSAFFREIGVAARAVTSLRDADRLFRAGAPAASP